MLDKLSLELRYKNDFTVIELVNEWDTAQDDLNSANSLLDDKKKELSVLAKRAAEDMEELAQRLECIERGNEKDSLAQVIDYLEKRKKHYERNM